MSQTELYQSVLKKLGDTPAEYLSQVDAFLSQLNRKAQDSVSEPNLPNSKLPSDTVSAASGRSPSFQEAIKPIRKSVTLDTLKQEQHYQP